MIEVETSFQPTREQLAKLLEEAEFLGEKINHDIYYDFPDYKLFKEQVKFRSRSGAFELKIKTINGASSEIEDEEEVKKYFNTELPLLDFINKNMIVITDYVNNRKKYKKEDFSIDVDDIDFGNGVLEDKVIEIELMVENEAEIAEAKEKIANLAKKYNIEFKKIPAKRELYLRIHNPELCDQLYGKENN
jgi:predicted adenylyl cyclase CyaB